MKSVTAVRRCAGISLIETMICLVILAIVALALANSLVASVTATSTTEERAAAIATAEGHLQKLAALGKHIIAPAGDPNVSLDVDLSNGVVNFFNYGANPGVDATFVVDYQRADGANHNTPAHLQVLNHGDTNAQHLRVGELVVWFDETATGAAFGRDLTGNPPTGACPAGAPDGKPDGVNFDLSAVGNDLDMDGLSTTTNLMTSPMNCFTNKFGRCPIGAIVRWRGGDGREQRVEVWTVVSFSECADFSPLFMQ